MQSEFDSYIEGVKNKPLEEKQKLLFKQLTSIASLTNTMCRTIGLESHLLVNDELMNLMKNEYTEDEYITALMALTSSIQESLCDFDDKISDIIEGTIE
jgi:hypothetical protein